MERSLLTLGCATGIAGYVAWLRPRCLHWGSTTHEQEAVLPGDELIPTYVSRATQAITINAPPDCVWPWVAQIGQDRAGFYSYTPLENLFRARMTNADRIRPDWQHRELGDRVWLAAESNYNGQAYMVVARWIPGRALVIVPPADWERIRAGKLAESGVWALILEPINQSSTRLIARSVIGPGLSLQQKLAHHLFWEPAHFVMEVGMLRGIKMRAESSEPSSEPGNQAELQYETNSCSVCNS